MRGDGRNLKVELKFREAAWGFRGVKARKLELGPEGAVVAHRWETRRSYRKARERIGLALIFLDF